MHSHPTPYSILCIQSQKLFLLVNVYSAVSLQELHDRSLMTISYLHMGVFAFQYTSLPYLKTWTLKTTFLLHLASFISRFILYCFCLYEIIPYSNSS